MKKQEEYTLFRISEQMQKDPDVLLLTAGTLTSQCNRFFLTLSSLELAEPPGVSATQRVQLKAVVVDSEGNIQLELEASGVPNQCSGYFVSHFKNFLETHQTSLCDEVYAELSLDELLR